MPTLNKNHVHFHIEHCSKTWGNEPQSSLALLDNKKLQVINQKGHSISYIIYCILLVDKMFITNH